MFPPAKLKTCACGEPTMAKKCKACELMDSLKNPSRT